MRYKKIILIFLIFVFVFGFVHADRAGAKGKKLVRNIGAGRTSECELEDDDSGEYKCTCQSANNVRNCRIGQFISDPICACCGDCTLENFIGLGVNIANIILKFLGVATLIFFIIGGLTWITSGGSADKVALGKKMVVGALIGMVIVLSAFTLVRFSMEKIGLKEGYLSKPQAKPAEQK